MQWTDDAEERGEIADVDAGVRTEQMYTRWRYILLLTAASCALVSLGMDLVLRPFIRSFISSDFDAPPWLVVVWFAPPLSALASFVGAFLCALSCCRGRRLLRHVGVVLADVVVMALMYVYQPWGTSNGGRERIVYAPFWSPPPWREMTGGDMPGFAVGRLVAQYMLVILISSTLILLLARKSTAKVGGRGGW